MPFSESLVPTRVVKFNMMLLVFTFKYQVLQHKCMKMLNQATIVATNDLQTGKAFIALAAGADGFGTKPASYSCKLTVKAIKANTW